jgi:hypothetical protein
MLAARDEKQVLADSQRGPDVMETTMRKLLISRRKLIAGGASALVVPRLILPAEARTGIIPRNRLAFPAGMATGIDPLHPASVGLSGGHGISAVARGISFTDISRGAVGAINKPGATAIMDGAVGPAVNFTVATQDITFSTANITDTNQTLAAIIRPTGGAGASRGIIQSGAAASGSGGWALFAHSSNVFGTFAPNGTSGGGFSTIPVTLNVPYFIAASLNATLNNFVAVRLDTGQIFTSALTGLSNSPASPQSGATIGCEDQFNLQFIGSIAAAMYSPTYLSMPQLLQWAADPWGFWYPQR